MFCSTLWLPAAVLSFQSGIWWSSCCTVAWLPVHLPATGMWLKIGQLIKGVNDTAAAVCLQVQIDHGGLYVAMPQQFFDSMQIGTGIKQMGGKGMAKGMYVIALMPQSGTAHSQFYTVLYTAAVHFIAFGSPFKQVEHRTMLSKVGSQGNKGTMRKQGVAVLLSLACCYFNTHVGTVYICNL